MVFNGVMLILGFLLRERAKRMKPSSPMVSSDRIRSRRHKLRHEIICEHLETLFFFLNCMGDKAVAQVSQTDCGVYRLGKSTGYSLEQVVLSGPALALELDKMTLGGPFQPQPFYEKHPPPLTVLLIALFGPSSSQLSCTGETRTGCSTPVTALPILSGG